MRRLFVCLLLAGCGSMPPHNISLVPRDGQGVGGTGSVPETGARSGPLAINVDGKAYRGTWTFVPEDGSVTTTLLDPLDTALAPGAVGGPAVVGVAREATVVNRPTRGVGVGHLRAADGSSLRCEFRYDTVAYTGLGACQTEAGKVYDLTIN